MFRRIWVPALFCLFMAAVALGAERPTITGLVFGDYYWIAGHHNPDIEGRNGFWFRRIYLTLDQQFTKQLEVRLRFEMNSPGDFSSATKLEPFVKDAYLKYRFGHHAVYLGLSPTPTWDVIEKFWGYRPVEKTPLDLQKFGSSRDFGIALKGSLDRSKKWRYHLMIGNGSGVRGETNEGKIFLLSLGFYPDEHVFVEIYGDYDDRPGSSDRYTFQGFLGLKGSWGRVGLHYAHQTRQIEDGDDLQLDIASIFTVLKLSDNVYVFSRYDRVFDPNPDGAKIAYLPFDPTTRSNFIVAGVDFHVVENVRLIPNIEIVFYDQQAGERPDTDVVPRLTFTYIF